MTYYLPGYHERLRATIAALDAMPRPQAALRMLERLNKPGCLSGSLDYCETLDALTRLGLPEMNCIYEHDRDALVQRFGGTA